MAEETADVPVLASGSGQPNHRSADPNNDPCQKPGMWWLPRLVVLFFLWAFAVVSVGVGAHAWVKSHQEKRLVKAAVSAPTVVTINTHDIDTAGIVVTIACGATAGLSMLLALLLLSQRTRCRFLHAQSFALGICAIWIFAGLIAFDFYFHTRSARVTATIGGISVPQQVINSTQARLGVTSVYKKIEYLRLVAIIPWFTWLFAVIGSILLSHAACKSDKCPRTDARHPATGLTVNTAAAEDVEKEKELSSPISP